MIYQPPLYTVNSPGGPPKTPQKQSQHWAKILLIKHIYVNTYITMAPGPTLLPDMTKYNKHSPGDQGQESTC